MSKYVVYDLEMCKVPKGTKREEFGSRQELIQIGAVMLNEEYKTVDTFMTYVAPRFGFVDSFIEKLTGITPANTQDAPSTEDALKSQNLKTFLMILSTASGSLRVRLEHHVLMVFRKHFQ